MAHAVHWIMVVTVITVMSCTSGAVRAHGPSDPPHQRYQMGDLKLESGQLIKDFVISYVTHGTLNAKKSNAVLMVTALGGNHHRIDFLIGPGKALDPAKYFIVATDAIGNGLTTSPSTSPTQPRMAFPRFTIRDMVHSQHRLLTEQLGIIHVVTVIGPSMGGMQALQWGASQPGFMDSLVALVPLGRTPAWSTAVFEMARKVLMSDPAWNEGNYTATALPERGMRLWANLLPGLIGRTPTLLKGQFPNNLEVLPWMKSLEDSLWKRSDPNDWIYQTWAIDDHNLGTTSGFNGDYYKALRAIKAKTLILSGKGDLLTPEEEALEMVRYIPDARHLFINPPAELGHFAAGGGSAPENEHLNADITRFLDIVTERGRKLE
jgi:homoserine O-acetyltransferase/O-succinyltransferase